MPAAVGSRFINLGPDIVARILATLIEGWEQAQLSPDVHTGANEVPMTERLRDGMRSSLWAAGLKTMVVLPGTESRSIPTLAIPDGRTDIPILIIEVFVRAAEHDPHAIIECKRIDGGDARLCREYVVNGIDRFRAGRYAATHAAGFMAGYVLSGTAVAAVARINTYLIRRRRKTERLTSSHLLAPRKTWLSRHPREAPAPPVTLHHVFLPVAAGG